MTYTIALSDFKKIKDTSIAFAKTAKKDPVLRYDTETDAVYLYKNNQTEQTPLEVFFQDFSRNSFFIDNEVDNLTSEQKSNDAEDLTIKKMGASAISRMELHYSQSVQNFLGS